MFEKRGEGDVDYFNGRMNGWMDGFYVVTKCGFICDIMTSFMQIIDSGMFVVLG